MGETGENNFLGEMIHGGFSQEMKIEFVPNVGLHVSTFGRTGATHKLAVREKSYGEDDLLPNSTLIYGRS